MKKDEVNASLHIHVFYKILILSPNCMMKVTVPRLVVDTEYFWLQMYLEAKKQQKIRSQKRVLTRKLSFPSSRVRHAAKQQRCGRPGLPREPARQEP